MLEGFFRTVSFGSMATYPVDTSARAIISLLLLAFVPSYIAYAKQSSRRSTVYTFSALCAVLFMLISFVPIEDFFIDRRSLVTLAKSLWALLLVFAIFDKRAKHKSFMKTYVIHPLESLAAHLAWLLFKIMPAPIASEVGGALGRWIGPLSSKYRKLASANLRLAFPTSNAKWRKKIISEMWDMMGRYVSEPEHFPRIWRLHDRYLEFENYELLDKLKGRPFIAFTSHGGSLGLLSIPFALKGRPGGIIYKFPSNDLTNGMTTLSFGRGIGKLDFIPNDSRGTRRAMAALQDGGVILVVPDQRIKGVPIKFFGRKAETPLGAAKLARHFNCPIVPIQIVREKGLRHRIIFHEPFSAFKSDEATMQKVNNTIEGWIRENPSQWFWVHNRWGLSKDEIEKTADA
jgi:KDO2-lipid IV(A) lauroyltransferase